ncbi:MAG: Asp-tRNA(Asn)/Glu-tRNA(Gln) amidotransferase subunit GatA [Candidatus Marinimicrobia bacterium]|nr:Asp-tRNA(Asn)/Glu-tRNA(Gln) amidotransferase subunit GatA [Candidatus Neomarinimicrobiota bacterium]MCF7829709.1 Asp-tRNA(Asn)/Glu-tRNA(Gln) amidotransferase subunit GatA [Candidatus Neomarinimicrobiota bacterium]MCF7881659.1 Asp-tRNA(Asn)/Glu-tRNA(Gln) amidotransferase subunit GatA [Candidatus Neomarinimicrobiota bacterium]
MSVPTTDEFLGKIESAIQILTDTIDLNIFIHAEPDVIQKSADTYAREMLDSPGNLTGKVIGIKDNINVLDMPTTCASNILDGYNPPYEATAVRKIREAGGFLFGKTNLDQFAMGSSTEHSYYGPTKNPVDPDRVPGGSSGGSAAAVKAGIVDVALGSETGGSVRQPAAFCGVVGLKPTYGRVSRYGLVAFASSFDQIGPFGNTVQEVADLLRVIAGHDSNDSTTVEVEVPEYLAEPTESLDGWNIGIPNQYFTEGLDSQIEERVKAVIEWLEGQGADIIEIDLPTTEYSIATYYILTTAEASSNLARFDGMRYGLREENGGLEETYESTRHDGFGDEVKRRIMLGTYVLSAGYYDAYYSKAQKVRRLIKDDFDAAFEQVDALITPTTPTTAFELGAKMEDPLSMYLSDIYTASANLSGIPAMSLPVGEDDRGLPIGMQILAQPFAEETIFQLGHYIEQNWSRE